MPLLADGLGQARVVRHARAARRLRVLVPGLCGDVGMARRIEDALGRCPGVSAAHADVRSGRVLVLYEEGAPLPELLRDDRPRPPAAPAPPAWGRLRRLLHRERTVASRQASRQPSRQPCCQATAPWHALTTAEVMARLGGSDDGLSDREAALRLRTFGENAPGEIARRTRLAILAAQVNNLPAWILLGSSGLSLLAGDVVDAGAILTVVALNAAIGYAIECKSEDLLASWRQLEAGEAEVLRGGRRVTAPASQLVPGDLLLLRGGEIASADARVIESSGLTCDEAPLTGESEPQLKGRAPVPEAAPLAERTSMIYAGTIISAGRGRALITATGAATELAQVRRLLEEDRAPRAPLERRLTELGERASALGIGTAIAAAGIGLLRGRPVGRVLRTAVALGVAALPEGLPVVCTGALVRCMQRMRERSMVVRRLASAETLGGITVICADKTGTLTKNEMAVAVLDLGEGALDPAAVRARPEALLGDPATLALATALLNSDVDVQGSGVSGSATERALVAAAQAAGLDPARLRERFPRRLLRERSDGVNYVITVHEAPEGGDLAFIKGAPEQVLALCAREGRGPLSAPRRAALLRRNDHLAAQGLRVLALGWRRLPAGADPGRGGYTFAGLVGLRDPLRPGAAEAVRAAARAGIRTLILTGDQQRTAEAVAREVGLRGLTVLSRVTPKDKLDIIQELRRRGEIVAMAGDGINDAPALKAADVGIAVGRRSSDLARQVADVVLAGEDLHSILVAVAEGRIVQDNLRRALRFLFATNLSELLLVLGAAILGAPDPLTPLQLLWINLLTDTLPALALALLPGEPEVLDREPAPPGAPLLDAARWREVARDGALLGALGAAAFALGRAPLAFSTLVGGQLGYTALCRPPGVAPDRQFLRPLGGAVALQLGALGLSPLRSALGLAHAPARDLLGFGAGLLVPLLVGGLAGGEIVARNAEEGCP